MGKKKGSKAPGGNSRPSSKSKQKTPLCIRCPDLTAENVRHGVFTCPAISSDPNLWFGFSAVEASFNSTDLKTCEAFLESAQAQSAQLELGMGSTLGPDEAKEMMDGRLKIKYKGKTVTQTELKHAMSTVSAVKQAEVQQKAAAKQEIRQAKQDAKAAEKEREEKAEEAKEEAKHRPPLPVLGLPASKPTPSKHLNTVSQKASTSLIPNRTALEKSGLFNEQYALRKQIVTDKNGFELFTNHFQINLPSNGMRLYEYVVSSDDKLFLDATKNKRKVFMRAAIKGCHLLKDQIEDLASDYHTKIISGKDLGITRQGVTVVVKCYRPGTTDAPSDVQLNIKLNCEFDMSKLKDYVEGRDMTYKEHGATEAMNIVVAKAVSEGAQGTFQAGNNKFYYRPGWVELEVDRKPNKEGIVAIRGYYCSVRPAMSMVTMNINTLTSAFYRPQLLDEYLKHIVNPSASRGQHLQELRAANDHLSGLRVYINFERGASDDEINMDHRRVKTVRKIDAFATNVTFTKSANGEAGSSSSVNKNGGDKVTIWDHFKTEYPTVDHGRSDQVAVNLGGDGENARYYLPHDLKVVSDQMFRGKLPPQLLPGMIDAARRGPEENRAAILKEGLSSLGLKSGTSMLNKLGITVSSNMLQIPARRAAPPTVVYHSPPSPNGGFRLVTVAEGSVDKANWHTGGKYFVGTAKNFGSGNPTVHFIFVSDDTHPIKNNLDEYRNAFKAGFLRHHSVNGLPRLAKDTSETYLTTSDADWEETTLKTTLRGLSAQVKLIVLMLPSQNAVWAGRYAIFKAICDQSVGITSAVFCEQRILDSATKNKNQGAPAPRDMDLKGYMGNIAMKLSLRIGNTTHTLDEKNFPRILDGSRSLDCIVMGADVTHPSGGSVEGTPSIAAVVGSVDDKFGMFPGSMRCQGSREEQITDMEQMAAQCFSRWSLKQSNSKEQHRLPKRVLFYRDGVSEGQYDMVLQQEVAAIDKAWKSVRTQHHVNADLPDAPEITAVVVAKRHHTRFFPIDPDDDNLVTKNKNLKPGTIVDSTITHPYYFDFYLQSHHSLQGTAKPAHYFVLQNGMNFTEEELQNLTNNLCYTYGRSCGPVSYAPPAYYADRLCERGRQYLKPLFDGQRDLRELAKVDPGAIERHVKDMWERGGANGGNPWHQKLNGTMFWM